MQRNHDPVEIIRSDDGLRTIMYRDGSWLSTKVCTVKIKNAYDIAQKSAQEPNWRLSADFIRQIHSAITVGIPHKYNQPGLIRSKPKIS